MESPQDFEYFDTAEVYAGSNIAPTSSPTEDVSPWGDDWAYSYDGYIPNTVDPDWWFTIYIIAGCLCVNLSLPLWIYFGKRFGFHETSDSIRSRKAAEWETSYNKSNVGNNNKSGDDYLLKQIDDARSVISGYSYAPGGSVSGREDYYSAHSSVVSGSVAMSRAGDAASVFSGTSGFADALLTSRPKRIPHSRRHAAKTKRIIVSKSCVDGDDESTSAHTRDHGVKKKLDVRMAAEFKKAEMDLLLHRNQKSPHDKNNYREITPNTTSSEVDFGSVTDDNRSEVAPSILSKLDHDAISVRDAVDARDGLHMPSEYDGKMAHYSTKNNTDCNSYISGAWNRLMTTVVWDKEMKKYLALAAHYSAQGILVEILGVVEIAFIGHFMGIRQASAYIVVSTITGFTGTITTGFYECAGVLIPQADGARNNLMVGRYMQLAMIFYLITAIPGAIFWYFYTEKAVLWYKFDEETAKMAQLYYFATVPVYATYGIDAVLYELLNTVGHEKYSTWFTVISSCIHTGIVIGMLYLGVTDIYYLGLFESVSAIISLIVNFTFIVRSGWLNSYWEGLFKTNGLRDSRAVKNVINTALPLSCAWILTYGEWEIMTLFCRYMGPNGAEVAAWGLMGYLWSAFETLTNGFGDAAEVRVGFRMGAGQVRLAKLCTDKALYVSFTTAIYATGVMFVLALYIPGWLTPDPTLQRMLFDIIPLIGFGQILMVWGMVAWAILGAQGRVRIATALEFFISWGIGAPVAAILVFVFNYNIEGIVGGLTISYTIGANVYLYMLHTSDWESLSAVVVAQSAAEGLSYDEFDWDDLPDNIQVAAAELGYNKWIWESNDLQPASDDKLWDELLAAERRAASMLGYTKQSWNGDTDTDIKDSSGEEKKGSDNTSDESSSGSEKWASLSKEAKNAAKILGYTQSIWDNDGSPPTEDKDWDELSSKGRAAAKTLGYTEKKWNGEDDDESDVSSYNTPRTTSTRNITRGSSKGSVLDQIISEPTDVFGSIRDACSFDSSTGDEAVETSIPSMTGISNGISSLLGFSNAEEKSKDNSAC